jgi:hypothetical protein
MAWNDFQNQPGLLVQVSLQLFALFYLIAPVEASYNKSLPHPANPFADPKHDPYNPLRYIASNVLTGIAFGEWTCFLPVPSSLTVFRVDALRRFRPNMVGVQVWHKVDVVNGHRGIQYVSSLASSGLIVFKVIPSHQHFLLDSVYGSPFTPIPKLVGHT